MAVDDNAVCEPYANGIGWLSRCFYGCFWLAPIILLWAWQ